MQLHLDTDFAGDPDDACALAMALGWPGAEIVGITTTADPDGRRAGYVTRVLELVGRADIPVAAGAGVSLTTLRPMGDLPDHERYWPGPIPSCPSPPGAAIDLLDHSIEQGATVAAIGPCTNLALLEEARTGRLSRVPVVAMGGWVHPPAQGLPAWGPERDWNIQCDTRAARIVADTAQLTLVTLPVSLKAHICAAHLPRLAASGPLGELLARQTQAHGVENGMAELGRTHAGLPDDLLNFHYDPVTCAAALGWSGAAVEDMSLRPVLEAGVFRFEPNHNGRRIRVVVDLDGDEFAETWITSVEAAQRPMFHPARS